VRFEQPRRAVGGGWALCPARETQAGGPGPGPWEQGQGREWGKGLQTSALASWAGGSPTGWGSVPPLAQSPQPLLMSD
jgi:hypothetical protein